MIDAFAYEGPAQGPKVLVLAGVRGDELPSVRACDQLIGLLNNQQVQLQAGQLLVIPRTNAAAVAQNKPFIDQPLHGTVGPHREELTHEQKLSAALIPYLQAADVVLELRTAHVPTVPFVYLDDESPDGQAWARLLGCDYLLEGSLSPYDDSELTTVTGYALRQGKHALAAVCGASADAKATEAGLQAALHTLGAFGLLPPPPAPLKKARHLRLTHLIEREGRGEFAQAWKNFEYVKAGTVVARYDDGPAVGSDQNGYVVLPNPAAQRGEVWFYLARALDAPGAIKA
jgi:predicted deacylase